jgi:hypothetical protein
MTRQIAIIPAERFSESFGIPCPVHVAAYMMCSMNIGGVDVLCYWIVGLN